MAHPLVVNRKTGGNGVYVGRPSVWGNPFAMVHESDREAVVEKFRVYIMGRPALIARAKSELRGKKLVCFCAPKACHADVLAEIANADNDGLGPDPYLCDSCFVVTDGHSSLCEKCSKIKVAWPDDATIKHSINGMPPDAPRCKCGNTPLAPKIKNDSQNWTWLGCGCCGWFDHCNCPN